jgi:hypothetical protein
MELEKTDEHFQDRIAEYENKLTKIMTQCSAKPKFSFADFQLVVLVCLLVVGIVFLLTGYFCDIPFVVHQVEGQFLPIFFIVGSGFISCYKMYLQRSLARDYFLLNHIQTLIDTLMDLADEYFPEPKPEVLQITSKKHYKHQKGKTKTIVKTIHPPKKERIKPTSFG